MLLRSIGAVVAGIVVNFVAVPIDVALHAAGVLPPPGEPTSDGVLALAFAYRAVLAVLGGYVTARLAPTKPMAHALVLGGIGLVLSTGGAVAFWKLGHHWYPLALVALCVPASWLGATLVRRRQ